MKRKVLGVIAIAAIVLGMCVRTAFADVSNGKNTYLTASHEAGHCIVDETLFPNQVNRVYLEAPSLAVKIKYLLAANKSDYFVTIPGKTVTTIVPKTKDEHLRYAAVLYAGQEAAYMMMIEKYPDMSSVELGLLTDNIYTGAASDNELFEESLINAMKAENKLGPNVIPSKTIGATEMPDDETATLYLKYLSFSMDEARRILEENRPSLRALSEKLFAQKELSGDEIRETIRSAKKGGM